MSIRYGQKIANLVDKKISSAFSSVNRDFPPSIPSAKLTSYTRPSDYISIPSISSSEQKVALLVFISNDSSNFLAFTCAGNYTVDWGDGVTENVSSGVAAQHIYDYSTFDVSNTTLNSKGFKQALVIITPQGGANLTSLNFQTRHSSAAAANVYGQPIAEMYISAPNLTSLTLGATSLTSVVFPKYVEYIDLINSGSITSFSSLFRYLVSLKAVDIRVTAAITTMIFAFVQCIALISVNFSSSANLASCTSTESMFSGCNSLARAPLFNTAAVTVMQQMFNECYSLVSVPAYDVSSVTNMSTMFGNCRSLQTLPLLKTANVTNMISMFNACYSLKTVPLFNTVKVTNMASMFGACYSLTTVPLFNTIAVTDSNNMFANCFSLVSVPSFDLRSNLNMGFMFDLCYSLRNVGLMNTPLVTSMSNMFRQCSSLENVPLFNTASVTNMAGLFTNCFSLVSVPLFNTASVTNMSSMFINCYNLTTVPLFNTANVTDMTSMFENCRSLKTVPTFNTVKVTNMSLMFRECYNLTQIPAFNADALTNVNSMTLNTIGIVTFGAINMNLVTATTNFVGNLYNLTTFSATNIKYDLNFTNSKLSQTALETIFANLGTAAAGGTRTLTLTNNWGAPTPVSLTGTTTAGSTTITMANTTGLSAGMQVTGTNTPLTTGIAVTFTDAGDTVNLNSHGLSDGDEVSFSSITTTTGIVINTIYFVVGSAANTFQVASTLGGAALPLTTNGSGTLKYNSTIASIVPNTSVTMTRPMVGSASQTLAFRLLGTYKAILKGFAVTG